MKKKVKKEKKYWMTQSGDELEYCELKDSHLLNILKWIERRAESGIQQGSCGYEGDDDFMTGDVWEIHGDEVLEHFDYEGLLKEANKRKLICFECDERYQEEPRVKVGMKCGQCAYGAEMYQEAKRLTSERN